MVGGTVADIQVRQVAAGRRFLLYMVELNSPLSPLQRSRARSCRARLASCPCPYLRPGHARPSPPLSERYHLLSLCPSRPIPDLPQVPGPTARDAIWDITATTAFRPPSLPRTGLLTCPATAQSLPRSFAVSRFLRRPGAVPARSRLCAISRRFERRPDHRRENKEGV